MAGPLISVVVPVFNGEATLRRALDSVFAQDHDALDVVVCDDGSTDATSSILREYESRLTVVTQANRGRGAARNAALARTRGDLVAMLDADDWWTPRKLPRQVASAARLPDAGLFCGNAYIVNRDGQIYRTMNGEWHVGHSGRVFPFLVRQNFVPMPTVLVRRPVLAAVGGFDETLPRSQDLEWLLRVAAATSFHYTPEPLACCDDRNWGTEEKRLGTYRCYRELLDRIEARLPDLAARYAHQFRKSRSDADSALAQAHEEAGRWAEAAAAYGHALTHTPASRVLQRRHALALYRAGQLDAAADALRRSLEHDPHDPEARFYLGTMALASGRTVEARAELETALYDGYLYQKFPECVNNLAVACARAGERERARELLEQAVAQRPFYSDALHNIDALATAPAGAPLRVTARRVFA